MDYTPKLANLQSQAKVNNSSVVDRTADGMGYANFETYKNVINNSAGSLSTQQEISSTESYLYEDYYSNDSDHYNTYYLEIYPFEIITLGYIQPALIILTTISNLLVASYFLTKKTRWNATNFLFVSIAVSDTLSGVTLLPNAFEVYAKDKVELSMEWCYIYMIFRFYVAQIFHTVSVWQTVFLGLQRFLCVCRPWISKRVCTFWKTFAAILIFYCVAMVLHIYHLINNKVGIETCRWQTEIPCKETCLYLWFCVILQHLIPCLLLLVFTIKTLKSLKGAQQIISAMPQKKARATRKSRDRIITMAAIMVVFCFLIPELPYGIYKLYIAIMEQIGNSNGYTAFDNHIIICVYEIALIVSFNANFWIYCSMMQDFRHRILNLVTCGVFKIRSARINSFSLSPRSSNGSTTKSRH